MRESAGTPQRSLRTENRRRFRDRVVAAAVELVRESGDLTFTMPQVADRAGVALRTLYRHFPKRDDLVGALALVADQSVALAPPKSVDELESVLVTAWTNLLAEEALMRAQHLGAAGALIRKRRVPLHRAATVDVIAVLCPDVTDEVLADVVDSALLLTSSTALFEFIDVLEVSVERGARLAARAVVSLIADANANAQQPTRAASGSGGPERGRVRRAE